VTFDVSTVTRFIGQLQVAVVARPRHRVVHCVFVNADVFQQFEFSAAAGKVAGDAGRRLLGAHLEIMRDQHMVLQLVDRREPHIPAVEQDALENATGVGLVLLQVHFELVHIFGSDPTKLAIQATIYLGAWGFQLGTLPRKLRLNCAVACHVLRQCSGVDEQAIAVINNAVQETWTLGVVSFAVGLHLHARLWNQTAAQLALVMLFTQFHVIVHYVLFQLGLGKGVIATGKQTQVMSVRLRFVFIQVLLFGQIVVDHHSAQLAHQPIEIVHARLVPFQDFERVARVVAAWGVARETAIRFGLGGWFQGELASGVGARARVVPHLGLGCKRLVANRAYENGSAGSDASRPETTNSISICNLPFYLMN
jgi:hypothetical protein